MKTYAVILSLLCLCGCVRLFGWTIHAPGVLSQNFYREQPPAVTQRVALYLPPHVVNYVSYNKGGKLADPQEYFIGESFAPMMIEAFQQTFSEFVFCEIEPDPELLKQYNIQYLVVIDIQQFNNRVGLKGQAVGLDTMVYVFDQQYVLRKQFTAAGRSDAQGVFKKKGGPQVNLNAAIENNIIVTIQFLRDHIVEN